MYTKDRTYCAEKSENIGDYIKRNSDKLFYAGKPDYIKRVEQRATAVIMARQLKKGVFHGI